MGNACGRNEASDSSEDSELLETVDFNNDGKTDEADRLISQGFARTSVTPQEVKSRDDALMNRIIVFSWPFFAAFLLLQPLLSNWLNNMWFGYSAVYTVYNRNGTIGGTYLRSGICDTPADQFECTDGQNFTKLALKYRGVARGCGCGQGVLGEGLCPMTSYGYTLSDFVTTEPAIAAMLGLGFFPLIGTWQNTRVLNILARPSKFVSDLHMYTMIVFQFSYIAWSMASCCIFPTTHAVLTVVFLGTFLFHWIVTAFICYATWGLENVESKITFGVAIFAVVVMAVGAIPRVFLTLNTAFSTNFFPNWNYGIGSYSFWFAEASGLAATFGVYPMIVIAFRFKPQDRPNSLRLWYSDATNMNEEFVQ